MLYAINTPLQFLAWPILSKPLRQAVMGPQVHDIRLRAPSALQFMAYAAYRSRLETAFLADELAAALATIPQHSRALPSPVSAPKSRPQSPQPQSPRALPSPRARSVQEASGAGC